MRTSRIHIALLVILSSFIFVEVEAQDTQFSQVFANPLYLNPAFAGDTYQERMSFSHRRQWPRVDQGYVSYAMGYDHNYKRRKLGIGIAALSDRAGISGLEHQQFITSVAKEIRLSNKSRLRIGIEGGFANRTYDRDKLIFWSDIQSAGEISYNDHLAYDRINYFDTGMGMVLYSNKYWIGAKVSHLNQPEHSFLNEVVRMDPSLSIHTGFDIPLVVSSRGQIFSRLRPIIHYKAQGTWDQLDAGAYLENGRFRFGLWYRGIPLEKKDEPDYRNNDGLIFLTGIHLNHQLQVGYSYDLTLSKLSVRSGGAHELTLIYEWPFYKRPDKAGFVPCPRF